MADFRAHVTAHNGGWRLQWHQNGVPAGDPIEVPAQAVGQLGLLGSTIAQAFDQRTPDGFARLPLLPSAALGQTGVQLRDLCCAPIADRLADDGGPHRLTVASDVAGALNLPWELLPVGACGQLLGCDRRWGVFRTPSGVPAPSEVRRGRPLRILFLAPAPLDQPALDYEKEEEAILRATATLQGALLFTAELGTYEELDELLQRVKPHVVHLSGHGTVGRDGVGRFCFEDDAGRTDARAAADLARLFAARDVPCVFLNGCQTSQAAVAGLCQALTAAGQPLALGWAASVADERATAFAETFYRELLGGEPVPAAAALARLRVQRDGVRRQAPGRGEEQELTFLLPQLYAARPVEVLFDREGLKEAFGGVETRYELLPGGVKGLREGFVGRRREQQRLVPALREGEVTFLLLHGFGGQGKSTLATRLVGRLRGSGFDVRAVLSRLQGGETAASCAARAAAAAVREICLAAKHLNNPALAATVETETDHLTRMSLAVDALAELKSVLVLDNFEDVLEAGPDGTWRIADAGLAEFYARVQTNLTSPDGGRVVVTSRYLPTGTQTDLATVRVEMGLHEFKDYEFLKLLKRDARVADRIRTGELPIPLLNQLYTFAGGTPRFLERLRTLLRTFKADELEAGLKAGSSRLVQERDKYLEDHFGPKLFAMLSPDARRLASRLGVSELPLPADALTALTGLDGGALDAAIRQAVEYGLLQVFVEADLPTLYLPPGVWRSWLAERLPGDERTAAHGVLAAFWRQVFEKDREPEVRVTVSGGLQACRTHAGHAGNQALRVWASWRLASGWERMAEWRAARAVLAEIPEAERDGKIWHLLATIDLNEGDYPAAREKLGKALAITQQTGNRKGEAAAWHQLATIYLNEGDYPAARKNFGKSLAVEQQIGNRKGEAVTWHSLATIDVNEGDYPAAREKLGKVLAITQQIGDRQGEAATWHQLASIDMKEGDYSAAREKLGKSLAMRQQIGDRQGEAATWHNLASIDLREADYPAARQKLGKALAMRQQIGERKGEAATWAQLATIDLNEGDYPAARQKLGKSHAITQQIGDRQGEAATFFQLGFLAARQDRLLPGAKLVGLCFLLDQAIGHGDTQKDLQSFLALCGRAGLTQPQAQALLQEIAASYQQDSGRSLLQEAFPDWP